MLKGTNCTVRHVLASDLNTFLPLFNDLSTRTEFFSNLFQSPEAMRKEFALNHFATEDRELYVIEAHDGKLVGIISHFKSRTPISREIGYRMFGAEYSGRGYMTEATRLLCAYLFRNFTYNRLELLMDPGNIGSERIAQKNGFVYEGTARGGFFINGGIRDTKVYSLLRAEWEASLSR
jgi:ribosomal-protein-alanine N-acetyltransferase